MDLSGHEHVEREMMLIKVHAEKDAEVKKLRRLIKKGGADVIEDKDGYYILEIVSSASEVDAFIHSLRDYRCEELVRSGVVGMGRGRLILNVKNV